jgi:rhamnose transport system permease protein
LPLRRREATVSDAVLRRIRPEQFREVILLIVTIGLLFFFWTQIPDYFNPRSVNRLTTALPITLVVAVGQVLVVLTRNIDLSVSSIVGMSAYVVGTLLTDHPGMPVALAVALSLLIGLGLGAINGLIVAYGGVPAVITTLGTLALYRVVLVEIANAKTVTAGNLPGWLAGVPSKNILSIGQYDLRLMVGIALLVVVCGQLVLRYLPFGRRLFAIGSNPDAARVAGLPAQRDVFLAFTLCGGLAGLGGFMWIVRFGNITVAAAQGLELQVVAAVVVGGVNIFGGSGSMVGAFMGVLLIEILQQSLLRWQGVSEFAKDAILGLLILVAVTADAIILGRLREMWVLTRRRDRARQQAAATAREGVAHGT